MRISKELQGLAAAAFGAIVGLLTLGTAWTSPRTWVHQELVTESMMNTHVRDNLLHLKENLSASKGFFRGLDIGTHPDADQATAKVYLRRLDQVALDDGLGVADWTVGLTATTGATGAGGLDTGTEQASTWYEIYAIHKSSDGTKNLLLHRAKDNFKDEDYNPADDNARELRAATTNNDIIAQGFKVDTTGPCPYIDVKLVQGGSPSGQIWAEIYADNGSGLPTGSALATSDKHNASLWTSSGSGGRVRFIFRTPATLTATTQYHLALNGNWTKSDINRYLWRHLAGASSYANGGPTKNQGGTWSTDGTADHSFAVYIERNNTSVTMPSGYDGKALIGYCYNDSSSDLDPFRIRDRTYVPHAAVDLGAPSGAGTVPILVDMSTHVPPIPITFAFWMRNTATTTFDFRIMPVPTYDAINAGHRAGGYSRLDGATAGSGGDTLTLGQNMDPILTETQGLYVRAGAGAIDALVPGSWEW